MTVQAAGQPDGVGRRLGGSFRAYFMWAFSYVVGSLNPHYWATHGTNTMTKLSPRAKQSVQRIVRKYWLVWASWMTALFIVGGTQQQIANLAFKVLPPEIAMFVPELVFIGLLLLLVRTVHLGADFYLILMLSLALNRIDRKIDQWPHPHDLRAVRQRLHSASYFMARYLNKANGKSGATKAMMKRKAAGVEALIDEFAASNQSNIRSLRNRLRAMIEAVALNELDKLPEVEPTPSLSRRLAGSVLAPTAGIAIGIGGLGFLVLDGPNHLQIAIVMFIISLAILFRNDIIHAQLKKARNFVMSVVRRQEDTNSD